MASEKKKVLVVDDQEEVRELVEAALRDGNFIIVKAAGGREGIQAAMKERPDIILLDIMMPNLDGIAACKILKRNALTKDIPVIFLTAKHSKDDVKIALEAGGEDYVVKPFSPDDLLEGMQKWIEKFAFVFDPNTVIRTDEKVEDEISGEEVDEKADELPLFDFSLDQDVMTLSTSFDSIEMNNFKLFRDAFAGIIDDKVTKTVLDIKNLTKIDGSGLALLVSVDDVLRKYKGGLRTTFPAKKLNTQFSFISPNYLFKTYQTVQEAVYSFYEDEIYLDERENLDDLNICLSCTFVNPPAFRYCGNCGTNLIISSGEKIFQSLRRSISKKVFSDALSSDIMEINRLRNIAAEEHEIPSEFEIEFSGDNINVRYVSAKVDDSMFNVSEEIEIKAPELHDQALPVQPNMKLKLRNRQIGRRSAVESVVKSINLSNNTLTVSYTEESKNIHTRKYFSINPETPIPVNFINPALQSDGKIYNGTILEISRIGLTVFAEEKLPLNKCLALTFSLPSGAPVASPLAVAEKSNKDFVYEIEFVVIDEKERSEIVQYMYKLQIEMSKK